MMFAVAAACSQPFAWWLTLCNIVCGKRAVQMCGFGGVLVRCGDDSVIS